MSEQLEQEATDDGAASSTDAVEWVTLGEAAARLDVDGGSLRRWAKRPHIASQFEGRTRVATRATRTGTRAATLYPFALVSAVWLASRDGEPVIVSTENVNEDTGTNEGQTRDEDTDTGEDAGGTVLVADQLTRAYLSMMTAELKARVEEQARTIEDLRADKKELQERVRQLEAAPPAPQIVPQEFVHGAVTNDNGEPVQVDTHAVPETKIQPRPFWLRWLGKG